MYYLAMGAFVVTVIFVILNKMCRPSVFWEDMADSVPGLLLISFTLLCCILLWPIFLVIGVMAIIIKAFTGRKK